MNTVKTTVTLSSRKDTAMEDFHAFVDRYGGDHRVRTLSCAEQYRSMAFAQLTYRESLRDIETCLSVSSRRSSSCT